MAKPFGMTVQIVDADGNPIDSTHPLYATFATGDIQIGAVELKNDSDDTRAKVGAGTAANGLRVTVATDDALHTKLGEVQASPTANTVLDRLKALLTGIVLAAGTAIIGKVGIDQTTPATTNGVVGNATSAAGGITSTARLASAAASTNATNVKTSAGRIYSTQGYNAAAYPVYLVLYDAATNPPVPGTTTIRKKIPIPAGTAFALDWPVGLSFASGIGFAFTKLAADTDTTVLVAGDILQFNLDYV